MKKQLLLFTTILLNLFCLKGQGPASPLDIPLYLSGNFGELRPNHFHSGIDFKTQGKIGLPIKAVMDGFVSRISVSPSGYGRVLYIDHPNGTTTVYAHLEEFNTKIQNFTLDSQYIKQTFRVDLIPSRDLFPVKKGEVIAYGGNTGSSGGPHLHFEIRDTETQDIMDALPAYMTLIEDTRRPKIQSFMIYPQPGTGIVNGEKDKQEIRIQKNKKGTEYISPEIQAWGKIGLAVKAYDYMDETSNTYGVKQICLLVDSSEIFKMEMNRFGFSETRYINSFIDWDEWTYNRSFYMKSFIDPGNKLKIYDSKNDGIINIDKEKPYRLTYILKDLYGNTETFHFTIEGKKQEIPLYRPKGTFYAWNKDNLIETEGVRLNIPKGNLYTDLYLTYSVKKNYTPYSALFSIGKRMPLHTYCELTLNIDNDIFPDKEKYGIVCVYNKTKSWIGGNYEGGKMVSEIRELGNYSVDIDTIPPVITELNPKTWKTQKKIAFKIRDNLSGIAKWHAAFDNQFVLFEYDAKTSTLFCKYDGKRMKNGSRKLTLWVEDACKNRKTYQNTISW